MPSIGDVAAELRAAIAMAEEAGQKVKAADDQAADALSPLQAALADSSSTFAHEGLDQLSAAREKLLEALTLIAAANETMSRYVASIAGSPGGGSAGAKASPTAPGPRDAPGYPHDRPHPISWSDLIHICHGDKNNIRSGGHLAGTGRPGKKEFPPDWDDEDVRAALTAVASAPESIESARRGKFKAHGEYRGVEIDVIVRPDGSIEAGWPTGGPGVRTNPE